MALLGYRPPVNYAEQQGKYSIAQTIGPINAQSAAFEDFLRSYKSSTAQATDALQDLNIEEDGLSDEYDFMDDVEGGAAQGDRRIERSRSPKVKYMKILQDIADRATSQILIELDDLEAVGSVLRAKV